MSGIFYSFSCFLNSMVAHLSIDEICTDNWDAFSAVFGGRNHQIGKHLTKEVEGVNNSLRARNRRFVRGLLTFPRKQRIMML
ncbi:MAG: hypothetical protein LC115_00015 [Bacteroidia bacterium]|nr:hypothetical protein [Bacteroidia bacterium]